MSLAALADNQPQAAVCINSDDSRQFPMIPTFQNSE